MPLGEDSLKAASINTSDNPYLKPLWTAVRSYNASGGLGRVAAQTQRFDAFRNTGKLPPEKDSDMRVRALALQDIMFQAAGFLTCKPPDLTQTKKRHARWDAMERLMTDVNAEALRIGVKLVDSPVDFRSVHSKNASVWLEVIDPRHREFTVLSSEYAKWRGDAKSQTERRSFWDFIGDDGADDIVLYDKGAKFHAEKSSNGRIVEIHNHEIDTSKWRTSQFDGGSNDGWGIFAVTTDGRLHIGQHSHKDGELVRHTSLTGGEPIWAAGEICIVGGKIKAISNLTGHYKLDGKRFMSWLATTPLLDSDVKVKARFMLTGEARAAKDDVDKPKIVEESAIAVATLGELKPWLVNKPLADTPFEVDKEKAKQEVPAADWKDLDFPDVSSVTSVDL